MKLNAPKKITWIISLILGALGFIALLGVTIPFVSTYACWIILIGLVLLLLGNVVKGL
ncbi:MAG TPA: hypothetical protein P5294_00210 [Smithellaceae bacterium]|nr:hypothetical protein [Smithellaceae bacterium]HRS88284.1 hypothetical protein [Smithellaceae bacterium]HRV24929.1 hypothetical protein [Smithellaceae bacterium]